MNAAPSQARVAYSVTEAAHAVGLSRTVISRAINDPTYPHPLVAVRMGPKGGAVRVMHDELMRWVSSHPEVVS